MSQLVDSNLSQFDRLPPHSVEAEMCLIASLMLCNGDKLVFAEVSATVSIHDFYQSDHQILYGALLSMHAAGSAIDGILVREELKRRNLYEEVGGREYLARLLTSVPDWTHYANYAQVVKEKSLLRNLIALGNDIIRDGFDLHSDRSAVEVIGKHASKLAQLAQGGTRDDVHDLESVLHEYMDRRDGEEVLRIPTQIGSLDKVIGGLRKGGTTIVGGRPGMGKSALLKQLLRNMSGVGVKCGLITVEESRSKVGENLISGESTIPNNRIAYSNLSPQEWDEVALAVGRLASLPVFIVDSVSGIQKIVVMARLLAIKYNCEVIAVDHIHLIRPDGGNTREQEISRISAELKRLWKELNVCGIEAAQLNRGTDSDRPTLKSLRDSGSLEQDGDTIILLHREDYYKPAGPHDNVLEAIVAKNKDGATGIVPLDYDCARYSIQDIQSAEPEIPEHFL